MYNLNVFADIENMLATHHLITRVLAPRGVRQVIIENRKDHSTKGSAPIGIEPIMT